MKEGIIMLVIRPSRRSGGGSLSISGFTRELKVMVR